MVLTKREEITNANYILAGCVISLYTFLFFFVCRVGYNVRTFRQRHGGWVFLGIACLSRVIAGALHIAAVWAAQDRIDNNRNSEDREVYVDLYKRRRGGNGATITYGDNEEDPSNGGAKLKGLSIASGICTAFAASFLIIMMMEIVDKVVPAWRRKLNPVAFIEIHVLSWSAFGLWLLCILYSNTGSKFHRQKFADPFSDLFYYPAQEVYRSLITDEAYIAALSVTSICFLTLATITISYRFSPNYLVLERRERTIMLFLLISLPFFATSLGYELYRSTTQVYIYNNSMYFYMLYNDWKPRFLEQGLGYYLMESITICLWLGGIMRAMSPKVQERRAQENSPQDPYPIHY